MLILLDVMNQIHPNSFYHDFLMTGDIHEEECVIFVTLISISDSYCWYKRDK